jgi:hypothetical protein
MLYTKRLFRTRLSLNLSATRKKPVSWPYTGVLASSFCTRLGAVSNRNYSTGQINFYEISFRFFRYLRIFSDLPVFGGDLVRDNKQNICVSFFSIVSIVIRKKRNWIFVDV